MLDAAALVRLYLLFFILPLWMLAGLTDYLLHKRTRIEETAGTTESLLHATQLAEAGIPVLLALLLDINALIILFMLIGLVLHEITALCDLSYASRRRYVSPLEQHIHSFMEVLPMMALSFVTILYWSQFTALFGFGPESARFELRPKSDPISTAYLVLLLLSVACFVVLPYAEELWRCIRAAPSRRLKENLRQPLRPSQAA
jgi:hypothetical protein